MSLGGILIYGVTSILSNVALFSVIPLLWHLDKERTIKGFVHSLGIYRPHSAASGSILTVTSVYLLTLAATITVVLSGFSDRGLGAHGGTHGLTTGTTILLYIVMFGLKTGIAEEIFFRGFIAKKLIDRLGYSKGNLLQALVFGMPHSFLVSGPFSAIDLVVRGINAILLGYTFGYIMDKRSGGNIVPAMIAHTSANIVSSIVLTTIFSPGWIFA